MTTPRPSDPAPPLDARDAGYVEREQDPARREAMVCTLRAHRRPDRLGVGDDAPDLDLDRLEPGPPVALGGPRNRPCLLIFGSYT